MPFSSLRLQAVFDREFPIIGGIDAFFMEQFAEFFHGAISGVLPRSDWRSSSTERLAEVFTERLAEDEEVWVLRL